MLLTRGYPAEYGRKRGGLIEVVTAGQARRGFRGMVRDLSADLRANPASTPILAQQERGFREIYLKGAVSGHTGPHEWKAGADIDVATIRERFGYPITDSSQFDPRTPPGLHLLRHATRLGAGALRSGPDTTRRVDRERRHPMGSLSAGGG